MKKTISLLLSVVLVLSMLPAQIFAGSATEFQLVATTTGESLSKLAAGDTVTVQMKSPASDIADFNITNLGIKFDTTKLTLKKRSSELKDAYLATFEEDDPDAEYYGQTFTAVATANNNGEVYIQSNNLNTQGYTLPANTVILSAQFEVKADVTGNAVFKGVLSSFRCYVAGSSTETVGDYTVSDDITVTIPAPPCVNHTFDKMVATEQYKAADATCMKGTLYYKSCECGEKGSETFESGAKDPDNHDTGCTLGDWVTDASGHKKVWSSCGAEANVGTHSGDKTVCTDKKECEVCGYEYADANDHTYATEWSKDASGHWYECSCGDKDSFATHTPDHAGSATEEYPIKCTICQFVIEAQLEHTHKYVKEDAVAAALKTEATCISKAVYYKSCACGAVSTNDADVFEAGETDADNHAGVIGNEWKKDGSNHWKEYTCCNAKVESAIHTEGSTVDNKCDTCGATLCEHTSKTHYDYKAKDCDNPGNEEYWECNECHATFADEAMTTPIDPVIPASHDLVAHAANPNSCEATGNTAYWECKAAGCGKYFSDAEGKTPIAKDSWITPVKGHAYATEWTYDETNHWYACANGCGIKKDEAAHTYDQQLAEEAYLKSEATCSAKAVYYKSCVCGAKSNDTFEYGEIDATAHDWVDGVCSIDSKHIQMEKKPGTKVEQEIAGLPATTPTVKVVTETGLEDVLDVTKIFKEGKITVEAGKISFELERAAAVGEYYIQIGDYVVSVVVAKDEDEPERGDRPTRPSATSDAVKDVIDMIDELPSAKKVTLDDEEDIEDARKAYEKLSKADKVKVTNYDALVEAEEALEALKTDDPEDIDNPFVDVDEEAYYADPVLWAVANNITSGTSAVTFSPDAVCTRAQVVTFLWRAAGCPAPLTTEMPFVDVEAGAYYAAAVQWAVENNITAGTSATTFDPNGKCTRGQIVTFLWRAQGNPAAAAVNNFVDVEDGAYYNAPVLWAVANGITNGTSTTTFSPAADCTRAQVVTFIYRCMAE